MGNAANGGAPTPRPRSGTRPEPLRSPEFDHLPLEGLRAYRAALTQEENRVSYWRRIVQARLDLLRTGERYSSDDMGQLRNVLASSRNATQRTALVEVQPVDDVPPLPDLAALWDREPIPGDEAHNEKLVADLAAAEAHLSAYRAALHKRLATSTQELVARYRENPAQSLHLLPLREAQARRAATG
jgi:hypothetical protein